MNKSVINCWDKNREHIKSLLSLQDEEKLKSVICKMLQDTYDSGHAQGYADYYYDHLEDEKEFF